MSNFPELAALGVEVFVFPIVATLWFNTRTLGGAPVAAAISYFWFLVRVGFSIRTPLGAYSPLSDDFATSVRWYFGYYVLLILAGVVVGWLICLVMDIREPIAFYTLFPSFANFRLPVPTPCNQKYRENLRDYYCCILSKGIERWCFTHIAPNYWFVFVNLLLALFTLFAPSLFLWGLLTVNKWAALFVPLVFIVLGYIFYWLYNSYRTDLRNFGASEYNMKARLQARKDAESLYNEDYDIERAGIKDELYVATQSIVTKDTLVMALVHLFGFLLIGGLIVIPDVANLYLVWPVGLAFILINALIFAIIGWVGFSRSNEEPMCPQICPTTGKVIVRTFASQANFSSSAASTSTAIVLKNKKPINAYKRKTMFGRRSMIDHM